ncbi:MAG TPA: MlaD family protein [Phenylobacterium sp.]|uniref:MlaD family protein n=1 Tax=Phenylobacterium sp. TaxID=1871053 RepID=UPI002D027768|nr:MlaD family protein [Phenylobacterium sp.]HSV03262.1 MlaD family protein [Phenylobacterium sp.]
MEKNANYALVGLSTLVLFVGLVIFVVWLARLRINAEYDLYDILFQGPINGLSQGGEVRFNGIKVGEVTKIALDRTNPSRVIARARVTSDVPIRADSYATLEPLGITGVNYVQITAGTATKPLLKNTVPQGAIPILRSQRSALSDLLQGGGTVLTRTIEALDRVNRVLSDQNIKTFSTALSDTQAVTGELRTHKEVIADAQKALQDLDVATQKLGDLASTSQNMLDTDGRRSLKNIADAAEEAKRTAAQAHALMDRLQGPTADFANNGLPQITAAVIQMRTAAQALQRLVDEIEASPQGTLAKPPSEDLKVKP